MKLNIVIVTIFLLVGLKFIGYYHKEDKGVIGFFGRLLNKTNSFKVSYSNIDKSDIDIVFSSEEGSFDTLVKHGDLKENLNYDYGPENFTVFYKGTFLCSNRLMSTNNNDSHDVEINISKRSNKFTIKYLFDKVKTIYYLDVSHKTVKVISSN